MAFRETITFDTGEIIVCARIRKRPVILNLTAERIISIQLDHGKMPVFGIFRRPSDHIVFQLRRFEEPIILYSAVLGEQFSELADGVRRFCHDNRITLRDYLASPEAQGDPTHKKVR